MTTYYRVTVERMVPDEDGDLTGKLVSEFMGPGEQLARFAPGAVAETLGAERAAVTVMMPSDRPEPEGLEEIVRQAASVGESDRPKRKRRTKAEIEADRAREAAGAGQGPTGNGDADLTASAAAVEAAEQQPATVLPQAVPPTAVLDNGISPPWNPFQP